MNKLKEKLRREKEGQVRELREEIEERVRQWTKELSVLRDVSSLVNRSLTLDRALKAVTEAVLETVPSAQRVVIHLCSETAGILVPIASVQKDRSRKPTPRTETIQTIIRRAAKEQRRIHIPDVSKETGVPGQREALSLLIIPLISDQKTVGTLSVYGAEGEAFSDHAQGLMEIFAGWAAITIKKMQLRIEAKQSQEAA